MVADLVRLGVPGKDATYAATLIRKVTGTIVSSLDEPGGGARAAYVTAVTILPAGAYDVTLSVVLGEIDLDALARLLTEERHRFSTRCLLTATGNFRVTIRPKEAAAAGRPSVRRAAKPQARRGRGGGGDSDDDGGRDESDEEYAPRPAAPRAGGSSIISSVRSALSSDYAEVMRHKGAKKRNTLLD